MSSPKSQRIQQNEHLPFKTPSAAKSKITKMQVQEYNGQDQSHFLKSRTNIKKFTKLEQPKTLQPLKNLPKQQKIKLECGQEIYEFNVYKDKQIGLSNYSHMLISSCGADEDSESTADIVRRGINKCFRDLELGIDMNLYSVFDSDEDFDVGSDTSSATKGKTSQ